MKKNPDKIITAAEFDTIKSHDDLLKIVKEKDIDINNIKDICSILFLFL